MWSVPPPIAVAAAAVQAVARTLPGTAWGLFGHLKGTVDERPAYAIIVAAIAVAAGIIVAVVFARRRLGYSPVAGADVTPLADTEPVTAGAGVTPRTNTEPVTAPAVTALDTPSDQRLIGAAMVISIVTAAASGMCAVESAHAVWRRAPHPVCPHFLEAVGSGIVAVASLTGCYLAYLRVPSTPAAQDSGCGGLPVQVLRSGTFAVGQSSALQEGFRSQGALLRPRSGPMQDKTDFDALDDRIQATPSVGSSLIV